MCLDVTNGPPNNRVESWTTNQNEQHWADELGGGGSSLNHLIFQTLDPSTSYASLCTEQMSWPATSWENIWEVGGTGTFTGDCWPNNDGTWSIAPLVTGYSFGFIFRGILREKRSDAAASVVQVLSQPLVACPC
jgi:hypothetical protein